jgi:1-acyl-sn-glycerol-3-phosphate acyltransferase
MALKKESALFSLARILSRTLLHGSIKTFGSPCPSRKPVIYVANHPSTLDPFFLISTLPYPVRILISEYSFQVPVLGWYLRNSGHVRVNAESGRKEAYDHAKRLLKKGMSLLIFAEGVISPDKTRMSKIKTGAVRLAMETGAPIVPVGISLDPSKIKKYVWYFGGGKKDEGHWYSNGAYAATFGEKLNFSGSIKNKSRVIQNSELVQRMVTGNIQEGSARLKQLALERRSIYNIFSLIMFALRARFAYVRWADSP